MTASPDYTMSLHLLAAFVHSTFLQSGPHRPSCKAALRVLPACIHSCVQYQGPPLSGHYRPAHVMSSRCSKTSLSNMLLQPPASCESDEPMQQVCDILYLHMSYQAVTLVAHDSSFEAVTTSLTSTTSKALTSSQCSKKNA